MTDEFVKLLDQGCGDLGIELSDQQKEQFFKYYEMLIEKNKVMNLTAITELSEQPSACSGCAGAWVKA